MERECKTKFLEHGLKEMCMFSLRKNRHGGNESCLKCMTSWLKAEVDLFFYDSEAGIIQLREID